MTQQNIESRTRIVGECGIYQEDRGALENEMEKLRLFDMMGDFGRLGSSEKTIDMLGDIWWTQTAEPDGDRIIQKFLCSID